MFLRIDDLRRRINNAGGENTPFLFGMDFEMNEGFFMSNPLSQKEVLFEVNGTGNLPTSDQSHTYLPDYKFEISPEEPEVYKKRFKRVMRGLKRGESYLANLTIETPVNTTLTLKEIFHLSKSRYKLLIPDRFVCFSPECFVKITDGKIFTFPMKGTIDASIPEADKILMNDEKETAEHNTIVDLLRNDLSRVSENVLINRFRYIEELQTNRGRILQVSSEIEGILPTGHEYEIGDILFKLLPAGSVSGAPKETTLRIIREAESNPRGYYTGVAGYFDGVNLDSFVLIRFIEQNQKGLVFHSGGGITSKSDCEKEYMESIQKVYIPI